jgi:hypothetical protein
MPTPYSAKGKPEAEVQTTFPHHCGKAKMSVGLGICAPFNARADRGAARMISFPV